MTTRIVRTACLALLALAGCDGWKTPVAPPASIDAELRQSFGSWRVVPIGPVPVQPAAVVDLGQALMFDKILSGNRDIACATCHDPLAHETDGLTLSIGTGGSGLGPSRTLGPGRQFISRNAPTLLNTGLGAVYLFADGRVSGFQSGPFSTPAGTALPSELPTLLAAQAMFPVMNRDEMRGRPGDRDCFGNPNELAEFGDSDFVSVWQAIMRRLLTIPEYVSKFNAAFPGTPTSQLGFEHAATAIAAFEQQALTKIDSPFDRYLNHDDAALTPEQKRGALLFFGTKARCSSCHNGPLLGGDGFANAGVPQLGPGTGSGAPLDLGRGELFNQQHVYRFAFRVTPLRNVELTPPYMHDGAFATLEAVLRHYNDVPRALREYDASQLPPALQAMHHGDAATISAVLQTLDPRLSVALGLSDVEMSDLVAFLKSLTDPSARDLSSLIPVSVPSGLPVRE
ncbi:MAG TPA: cytochrome c peroxidase [Gemmatimonadales bacterium]|nr:cytochrome c peroxidase [Gemmatimonadales bacterium]